MDSALDLWSGLLHDAALDSPDAPATSAAVERHLSHRRADSAGLVGSMIIPDTELAAADRAAGEPLDVTVINSTGAGGLLSLAERDFTHLRVGAVHSPLRDLDDLAGNAARVAAAARALPGSVQVFVEFPARTRRVESRWDAAAELVEAEGMMAALRLDSPELSLSDLHDQLRVLVETDLAFAVSGSSLPWSSTTPTGGLAVGFGSVLAAVLALVDDADDTDVRRFLALPDALSLRTEVGHWAAAEVAKVRRRVLSIGCAEVTLAGEGTRQISAYE